MAMLAVAASDAAHAGYCGQQGCGRGNPDGQSAGSFEAGTGSDACNRIELVRLNSRDADGRRNRTAGERARNDFNQIIAYYNAAIRREPKDDDAYFHRGIASFYAGDR